jgi:hypothetical protein
MRIKMLIYSNLGLILIRYDLIYIKYNKKILKSFFYYII